MLAGLQATGEQIEINGHRDIWAIVDRHNEPDERRPGVSTLRTFITITEGTAERLKVTVDTPVNARSESYLCRKPEADGTGFVHINLKLA